MSRIDLSKDSLFLLAKKISNKNISQTLIDNYNINKIKSESLFINSSQNEQSKSFIKDLSLNNNSNNNEKKKYRKKRYKFKNKFLDKDNIQINEEKMRNLLNEKKKKMKLTLSHRNDINDKRRKIFGITKMIDINLEEREFNDYESDRRQINNNEGINHYMKLVKHNNRENYKKNDNYNSFTDIQLINNNKLNMNKKKIYNSNSDYFDTKINQSFFTKRNSLIKAKNNSRNDENINNKSISQFYSLKKYNDFSIIDTKNNENEYNINKNEIINNNNNINNNINININISNSNNKDNNTTNNSLRHSPRVNKILAKKYISYYKNANDNNGIKKIPTYNNLPKDLSSSLDFKRREIIFPSSEKMVKKYISHKNYYKLNKNKNNNNDDIEDGEEEEEETYDDLDFNYKDDFENNNENYNYKINKKRELSGKNEYLIKNMDYNIYNINLNFISEKRNYSKNKINYNNYNDELYNKIINSNLKKQINNEGYYKSHGKNNQFHSIIITNKKDKENNKIKNNIYKYKENNNNSIINNNSKNDIDYKYDYKNTLEAPIPLSSYNIINNKRDIIQLEDLLILEGKLFHLLNCLKNDTLIPKMCVEWWSFYTYCSFYGKFPKLFPKIKNRNNSISDFEIANNAVLLELLTIILTYEILNVTQFNKNLINVLINLIKEIHQNFLIECDYILSKVNIKSNNNNIWIIKLKNLIITKMKWNNKNNNMHLILIKEKNDKIQKLIDNLINSYSNNNKDNNNIEFSTLKFFNKNISDLHLKQLSKYFNKIINKHNAEIGRTFSYIIKTKFKKNNSYINENVIEPYLPKKIEGNKKYTLVLDLDETLISFRFNKKYEGILKTRPGLYNFLKNVGMKYELVIFTAGTQEYADPILDIIENKQKIFSKRLYRQHTVIIDNIFVKDLTKLGRDLSKIIIIDNMPQNFYLQKENGIFIKNYFGQDTDDTALIDLVPILLTIASKPNNDVRKELKKFREEIFTKITTNLK